MLNTQKHRDDTLSLFVVPHFNNQHLRTPPVYIDDNLKGQELRQHAIGTLLLPPCSPDLRHTCIVVKIESTRLKYIQSVIGNSKLELRIVMAQPLVPNKFHT